jgi:hypothetical protein
MMFQSFVVGLLSSLYIFDNADAFSTIPKSSPLQVLPKTTSDVPTSTSLFAKEKGTIQILMSDTGGGHRASANALRDAFDELYPGQIEVDIVDIFTDYGPFFPINAFVPIYKIMAAYPILWEITFKSGATPFGLWFNECVLEVSERSDQRFICSALQSAVYRARNRHLTLSFSTCRRSVSIPLKTAWHVIPVVPINVQIW